MAEMKRSIKDSVFSYLFRQPKYTLELYRTLHPEDSSATEDDMKLITIENVLSNGLYNDLGLLVRNTLIVLVEAQSTFSVNICLRLLLYLAETYKKYVEEHKLDLYAGKAVQIPRPELYVVYTGERRDIPDVIHLSDLYGETGSVEITVQVIRSSGDGNIVDQYIRFCAISDEERKKYGYTMEAVVKTIRRCLEENILTPFLVSRKEEVQDIMITLFNEEKISEIHDYNLVMQTRAESRLEMAKKMLSLHIPHDQIAAVTDLSLAEVEELAV